MHSLLKDLSIASSFSGGTSLITYFVPSNYSISLVNDHFSDELCSASNIKDKNVRSNVITAIKTIQQQLKTTKSHENGLVIIAGETKQYI